MREHRNLKFFAAVAFCLVAAGADKPDSDKDKEALKGTWRYVSAADARKETTVPAEIRLVLTGDTWKTARPGQDPMGGKYKIDASKRPPQIDLMVEEDPGRPIVQKGIYELDGDTLRIRFAAAGKPRPADFKGSGAKADTTWELKRVATKE